MKKVTIIIPIYNVAKYIERCVVSLFEQDFKDIEYIFVNDCTPDNSVEILEKIIEKYPNRKPNVKIIHHEKNRGLGWARKTGLEHATGEYILHTDSDDWCELDMVLSLYNKAKETNADIVACDIYMNYVDKEIYKKQNYTGNIKNDFQQLLLCSLSPSVCNKLTKRSLYIDNNIYPPTEISMFEDRWLNIRLFSNTNKIAYVNRAFYHYWQGNENSICTKTSTKTWNDIRWYVQTTKVFLEEKELYNQYKDDFLQNILWSVFWLLGDGDYKKTIKYVCPESDKLKYIWRKDKRFIAKIKCSLYVLNLGFIAKFLLKIKRKMKN
ncbi:MAG: glycosyltransferase family 2 protein [Flavobacteriaceae bacterium]|nr:glycosyltransferase family 2 protein [Flavobacteriaceae bacterium]